MICPLMNGMTRIIYPHSGNIEFFKKYMYYFNICFPKRNVWMRNDNKFHSWVTESLRTEKDKSINFSEAGV